MDIRTFVMLLKKIIKNDEWLLNSSSENKLIKVIFNGDLDDYVKYIPFNLKTETEIEFDSLDIFNQVNHHITVDCNVWIGE